MADQDARAVYVARVGTVESLARSLIVLSAVQPAGKQVNLPLTAETARAFGRSLEWCVANVRAGDALLSGAKDQMAAAEAKLRGAKDMSDHAEVTLQRAVRINRRTIWLLLGQLVLLSAAFGLWVAA